MAAIIVKCYRLLGAFFLMQVISVYNVKGKPGS